MLPGVGGWAFAGFQLGEAGWKVRQGGVEGKELAGKGKGDGRFRGGAGINPRVPGAGGEHVVIGSAGRAGVGYHRAMPRPASDDRQ